jgi:hypothetical protein
MSSLRMWSAAKPSCCAPSCDSHHARPLDEPEVTDPVKQPAKGTAVTRWPLRLTLGSHVAKGSAPSGARAGSHLHR